MFNTVLVGADGSATARRAVEAAATFAAASGGTLHILSAYDAKTFANAGASSEGAHLSNEGDVDALLQTLSFIAKRQGVEATLHAATGDASEAIVAKATEVGADLVVVGNRGMKGVRRVLGSVPNSVAHGAPCSVLIFDTTE